MICFNGSCYENVKNNWFLVSTRGQESRVFKTKWHHKDRELPRGWVFKNVLREIMLKLKTKAIFEQETRLFQNVIYRNWRNRKEVTFKQTLLRYWFLSMSQNSCNYLPKPSKYSSQTYLRSFVIFWWRHILLKSRRNLGQ